jgi:hypothetical protein
MTTEAPAAPVQTPASGATTPASPVKAPDQKNESRFNRENLLSQIQDPLTADTNVINLRYPASTGSEEYPHYVVFYPLVREGTKLGQTLLSSGGGSIFDQTDQNRADPENGTAAAATAGALIGAATGAAFTAGKATSLGESLAKNGGNVVNKNPNVTGGPVSITAKLAASLTGGILGAGAGALGGGAASAIAGEQRLVFGSTEIALYIPDKVATGYSANYETADLGALVGAVASGKMSAESLFSDVGGSSRELGDYALRKLGRVANVAGFDSFSNVIQATSKKVENPYKEQLFRSMGFRKFGFDYRFAPRSEQEAETVFGKGGIIEQFTMHMHPTRSQNGLFLTYPSEFLIIYYHNGTENNFIRKISNCALTDMVVEYDADGFTTFSNGCPSEASVRLQFTELETLTTDRIEKGF